MIETPTHYKDYLKNQSDLHTEQQDYLKSVVNQTDEKSQPIAIRLDTDFVDEIDDISHTLRMNRSKFIRLSLRDRVRYFKEVEEPFINQVQRT